MIQQGTVQWNLYVMFVWETRFFLYFKWGLENTETYV